VGLKLKYSLVADSYEKIEATTKRLEMTDLLVAEKMTIQSIVKASEIEKKEVVKHWHKIGDLGSTAEKLLEKNIVLKGLLTVDRVYDTLDKIAHTLGKGSVQTKINLLSELLVDATPKEAKYLVRTITGRLRLGIGDMTFLNALAIAYIDDVKTRKLVERAYNLSSDLGLVSQVLAYEGIVGIRNFNVRVGIPLRPMLAGRMKSAEEILKKFGGQVSAEYKYDGLRIQCHISPRNISLFSRRLENLTSQFPDVVKALKLGVNARETIIDGECVAVDSDTGEMQPFQVITQRRGRKHDI
jgi:DNA ligase-1